MATQVRLTSAVQGARHEPITVTWGIDLTDAVITGTKQLLGDDTVYVLDGSFVVSEPEEDGVFVWTLGAGDVGTAGHWHVQFKATYASDYAMTCEGNWRVYENQGAGIVPSEALVGVTESQAAFLDDVNIDSPTDGQVLTWDAVEGEWVNDDAGGGGLANIVEDTTPQLGGNLDLNGFTITGLVIGTNVQAYDAGLTEIAALAVTDGNIIVGNGTGWVAENGATALTSLGAASAASLTSHTGNTSNPHGVTAAQVGALTQAAADALYQAIGSYQAQDAELTALAGLVSAADKLPYFTGLGTAALADLTAAGRELINDADNIAQRTTLGLGTLATQSGTFSGGGTLATGGNTLTVPATGTAALLGVANSFTDAQSVTISTSGTAAPVMAVTLGVNSTGTPSANFGGRLLLQAESTTAESRDVADIVWQWATATHASRKGRLVLSARDGTTAREGLRVETDGSAPMIGFLGANAVVRAAHIADPAGGGTQDAEARTAINAILVVLENLGLVATS